MNVNPVQLLPLAKLRHNPDNPKRPMGARQGRGLRKSLQRFGFAGVLVVAGPDPDGTYEVLDGNTRLDELAGAGGDRAPCVVLDLDADGRKEFALAHDRNRKLFDEDAVVAQLKELAGRGKDVKELAELTATDNLRYLLQEAGRAKGPPPVTPKGPFKPPEQGSLVLYGPAEDVQAVRQLVKRMRGRVAPLVKVRQSLEQAEQFQDMADETFLLCLCSAISRVSDYG